MLPINASLVQKEAYAEASLRKAAAFGLEKGVKIHIRIIRSRSICKAVQELIDKEGYDLLILGNRSSQSLSPITEKILASVKCRVWLCRPGDNENADEKNSLI
jgi:nucleotide-binding universal stress UspA family protein